MANRTAWTPGNGVGLTWTQCFATADLSSLATAHSILSSQGDIANGTAFDQFADVAFELFIPSTTLVAGAALALCVFDKFEIDGTTNYYGDNSLAAGTSANFLTSYGGAYPFGPTITGAAQTVVTGSFKGIILPPRTFRFALVNNLGVTLDASGTAVSYCSYTTYNQNLNS